MAISGFAAWLRGQTNKHKRPFQEHTITDLLNRFFAGYLGTHSQGGTNTLQRSPAHLFAADAALA
jgi:hypothetical protein